MKKFLFLAVIFSLLVFACDFFNTAPPNITWNIPAVLEDTYNEGDIQQFWAQDLTNRKYYQLDAVLLYKGIHCNIWVEQEDGENAATKEQAEKMADTYDNEIYEKLINAFSYDFLFDDGNFYNVMQVADFMGDQNGKLCILLLDIRDGFEYSGGYVAGYFDQINFFDNYFGSNKRDIIYVDTVPGNPGTEDANKIMAHEMQHLMNFVTSYMFYTMGRRNRPMDLWINEGLSTAAEWIYSENYDNGRIDWYNTDYYGTIAKGNNFFVWDNYRSIDPEVVLDDYATVYLFFQWLRLQAGGIDIYESITNSRFYDYRAVTNAAKLFINSNYGDWSTLLETWLAANFINAESGTYGYLNEDELNTIKKHYAPSGSGSILLYPGEGVYSYATVPYDIPGSFGDIRYSGIDNKSLVPVDKFISAGKILLTFNANPQIRGAQQMGTITGNPPPFGHRDIISLPRTSVGFYAISAGEMRGRSEHWEESSER